MNAGKASSINRNLFDDIFVDPSLNLCFRNFPSRQSLYLRSIFSRFMFRCFFFRYSVNYSKYFVYTDWTLNSMNHFKLFTSHRRVLTGPVNKVEPPVRTGVLPVYFKWLNRAVFTDVCRFQKNVHVSQFTNI